MELLIDASLEGQERPTPAQQLIGAFASPEDAAVLDEAMSIVKERRAEYDQVRKFEP